MDSDLQIRMFKGAQMNKNKKPSSIVSRSKTTVEMVKPRLDIESSGTERRHPQEPAEDRARRLNPDAKYAFGRDKYSGNT